MTYDEIILQGNGYMNIFQWDLNFLMQWKAFDWTYILIETQLLVSHKIYEKNLGKRYNENLLIYWWKNPLTRPYWSNLKMFCFLPFYR